MKARRFLALAAAMMVAIPAAFAAVSVTNVVAHQRYPWNGMVDIDYEVVCDDSAADVWVYPVGYDKDMAVSMAPRSLTGDGVEAPVKAGKHRMTWNVTADYPNFASTAFTVKFTALTGGAPYMVIDLSGGVDALSYPVTYLSHVPEGGWSDLYKTTNLVLRLIPPGTFMMGSPSDELGRGNDETIHQVTLTNPFYIGVFEVTQRQYELVMGTNPSFNKDDIQRPVEMVSYYMIRGSFNGAGWPMHNQVDANSFMGRLRSKTNLLADLPTEAQWEYACRAGTGTSLNSGRNLMNTKVCTNLAVLGWYNALVTGHLNVGGKLPNAWGLYDAHGNVWEWCLDWRASVSTSAVTNPVGAASGYYRELRGGSWAVDAASCRSANRGDASPDSVVKDFGFRLLVSPVTE